MASLLTPAPTFLVNERGGPVPPADILSRTKTIHAALSLRFMPDLDHSTWALTWEWPDTDSRWARVRSGEISRESAYDIIGYLPLDCTVEQAPSYIEAHLKHYPKEEIRKLHASVTHWNDVTVPAQQVAALLADTLDDVARAERAPKGQVVSAPSGRVGRKKP